MAIYPFAKEVLLYIIDDKENPLDYFNITEKDLVKLEKIVAIQNIDLYNIYMNVISYRNQLIKDEKIKDIHNLYNYIINGVNIDNEQLPFISIDYFLKFNLDKKEINEILLEFPIEEIRTIKRFMGKEIVEENVNEDTLDRIINSNYMFGEEKVTPSLEDKYEVINFLKDNNIPINKKNFVNGLKRIIENKLTNEITIYQEKTLKRD